MTATIAPPPAEAPEERVRVRVQRTGGDRLFRAVTVAAGATVLGIMGLIGLFLVVRSAPAFRSAGTSFFTEEQWNPDGGGKFGIKAVLFGTVEIAVLALLIAVPLSIGAALFITEYCPRVLRRPLTSLIDLLAAIPSLVYGIWGFFFLAPYLTDISRFLSEHARFVPFFKTEGANYAASPFIAGLVVSLMVVPICTAVMREGFSQAPPGEKEGALALGGTRWGMIRSVVLPFGRGAMIGGAMLGLGRALGETIAVAILLSPKFGISTHVLETGGSTIASLIALRFGEAGDFGLRALMAAGLVLFVVTLIVNFAASSVVARSRSGAGTEI